MKVKIAEIKAKLSAYIARVEAGELVEITNHGRVVARLVRPLEEVTVLPPRDKTAFGRVKNSRLNHGVEDIDDLLARLGLKLTTPLQRS
jgi:prevent-host-death family protein